MAASCTMFSISESELKSAPDTSLPGYDQTSVMAEFAAPHTLELGPAWAAVHAVLGSHTPGHVLGFLAGGGETFTPLEDGPRSSGRYFAPDAVGSIASAVDRFADMYMRPDVRTDFDRLREFLHKATDAQRGIVVHLFT